MLNKLSIEPFQTQQKLIEAIQNRIHEECTNIDSIDLIECLENLNEFSETRQLLETLMNINNLDTWIEEILEETIFEVDPLLE